MDLVQSTSDSATDGPTQPTVCASARCGSLRTAGKQRFAGPSVCVLFVRTGLLWAYRL